MPPDPLEFSYAPGLPYFRLDREGGVIISVTERFSSTQITLDPEDVDRLVDALLLVRIETIAGPCESPA